MSNSLKIPLTTYHTPAGRELPIEFELAASCIGELAAYKAERIRPSRLELLDNGSTPRTVGGTEIRFREGTTPRIPFNVRPGYQEHIYVRETPQQIIKYLTRQGYPTTQIRQAAQLD